MSVGSLNVEDINGEYNRNINEANEDDEMSSNSFTRGSPNRDKEESIAPAYESAFSPPYQEEPMSLILSPQPAMLSSGVVSPTAQYQSRPETNATLGQNEQFARLQEMLLQQ